MEFDETRIRSVEWHGHTFHIPKNSLIRDHEVPDQYQALVRRTFEQRRDIDYHGFEREYFDAAKSVEKYPDPSEREKAMRTHFMEDYEKNWGHYIFTHPLGMEQLQALSDRMRNAVDESGDRAWHIFADERDVIAVEERRLARLPEEQEQVMRPTDQDMQRVTGEIEALEAATYEVRLGGTVVEGAWRDLSSSNQATFLEQSVDWSGFSVGERGAIERRVVEGESPEFWMDDIQFERQAAQAELIQGYQEVIVNKELDRVLTEFERQWTAPAGWEYAEGGARTAEEWEKLGTGEIKRQAQPEKPNAIDRLLDHIEQDHPQPPTRDDQERDR